MKKKKNRPHGFIQHWDFCRQFDFNSPMAKVSKNSGLQKSPGGVQGFGYWPIDYTVNTRKVTYRWNAYGHTPLNGFPILYSVQNGHPKLLRFLGYKATGFFQLLNFFKDHNNWGTCEEEKRSRSRIRFGCYLQRQDLDAK